MALLLMPVLAAFLTPSGAPGSTSHSAPYPDSDQWAYRYDFTLLPELGFEVEAASSADADDGSIEASVSIERDTIAIEEPRGRAGGAMVVQHPVPEGATTLTYEAVVHVASAGGTLPPADGPRIGGHPYYFLMAFLWVQDDGCFEFCFFSPDWVGVTDDGYGPVKDETIALSVTIDLSDEEVGENLIVSAGLDLYVGAGSVSGVSRANAIGTVESITLL